MIDNHNIPRIALIADVEGWAFDNISKSTKLYLGDKYCIDIYYIADYRERLKDFCGVLFLKQYDLVHFFWRKDLLELFLFVERSAREFKNAFISTVMTFSIYDHCFLGQPYVLSLYKMVFNYLAAGYTVSSDKLSEIYTNLEGFTNPSMTIEDGVNLDLFFPKNTARLGDDDRDIIIGWVGNSEWGVDIDGIDHKGFHSIIKPALSNLQQQGFCVVGNFADRKVRHTPLHEMVTYYEAIDICICASDVEGTPNPVLEAMACGVPVISTDVGIVPQVFGALQKQYILKERSIECLEEKLKELLTSPEKRVALSAENLERISRWTRKDESLKWDRFFQSMLMPSVRESQAQRKTMCLDMPFEYYWKQIDELTSSYSWKVTSPLRFACGLVRRK